MKTAIVTTTINVPQLLLKYAENAHYYGHREVEFIVIGDRKSPAAASEFCKNLERFYPCAYWDVAAQRERMSEFPDLWQHLPFDSIQRRNIGMLLAWESGADVIVTIDDDNFVTTHDFIAHHAIAGTVRRQRAYGSTSGWFNVCSILRVDNNVEFYHRGFPQHTRWAEANDFVTEETITARVAVNAGLWLDDPDIDAITRMNRQPIVRGFIPEWSGNIALQPGTWSPFNSQNTAMMRDIIPAYFLSPYVGRYDDIWASYIVDRIAEHLGDVIAFGEPLVRQQRNPHDLWKDLNAERIGMQLTDEFCAALRGLSLDARTYSACFGEVTAKLSATWLPGAKWSDEMRIARDRMLEGMNIWHSVFTRKEHQPCTGLAGLLSGITTSAPSPASPQGPQTPVVRA